VTGAGAAGGGAVDRQRIHDELEEARAIFTALVASASPEDLRRGTNGTRWSNQQLLFHLLLGYLVVRRLLWLVRVFGALPPWAGRAFAAVLDAVHRPFHLVNDLGSRAGASVVRGARLVRWFDATVDVLHRRLDGETEEALHRRMAFPTTWDPYFRETMSLADVYRFGFRHFEHHRRQLTLGPPQR
jgi:hypothetical protein